MNRSDRPSALVVEDEFLIAQEMVAELRAQGFEDVQTASSLAEGEACLRKRTFAFAILDVNLGSELVFPLAEKLSRKHVPFVFCTAMSKRDMPAKWSRFPALSKPFDGATLAALMPIAAAAPQRARRTLAERRPA